MKLTLGVFAGAVPALHPKLIADTAGVNSLNQKPGRGDLRPWKQPLAVASVSPGRQTIYRMGRDVKSDSTYWLSWPTRVHVMRGYNVDDTTERTYFTGSGIPKWVDNTFALAGSPYPTATRTLGVPAPVTAAIVTSNGDGTAANTESRYVTYTYVTTKGDESAPGPVSAELVCKTDDSMTAASMAAAPGGFDINRIRVYATVSGASGETEFFFQNEISSGLSATVISSLLADDVLATDGWLPPPADLTCLTPMWNGMAAGISGNSVCISAPFATYAWPFANRQTPADVKPVGLGRWGQQNLVVLTTGVPHQLIGTSPDQMDLQPAIGHACCSEPSIVGFDHGVVYASEDGLAYFGQARAPGLITSGLLTRDDWQAMNPDTISGGIYEGAYLGFYTDAGGARRGFLIDPISPQGIFFLDVGYPACWFDELQDALFVLDAAGNVKKWDAGAALMTATFQSKVFSTPSTNFQWGKVVADAYPLTLKVDAGPFTADELTALVAMAPSELSAVGDKLRGTYTVTSEQPFELYAGFQATDWQMQTETQNPVQAVLLATSVKETA